MGGSSSKAYRLYSAVSPESQRFPEQAKGVKEHYQSPESSTLI
jgi:hypothetical protein